MSGASGTSWRVAPPALWARVETFVVLVLTLLLLFAYLTHRDSGPLQAIEGKTLDWRFQLRGPEPAGDAVAIVAIDDQTLARLGRWPFPRAWLARAVDALAADGARGIVFDLLLVGAGAGAALDPNDQQLRQAIAQAGNVIVPFAFVFDPDEANRTLLPNSIVQAAYSTVRKDVVDHVQLPEQPAGALVPLESFLTVARPAHVTVFVEPDRSLRFAHIAIGFGDAFYPSLPVEAVRLYLGLDRDDLALHLGAGLSLGERFVAADRDMALAINYAGPAGSYATRSLIDVANGDFPAGSFRDRLVLIGPQAAALGDQFDTPYAPMLSGVEVFANVIDNLLGRGFLLRSSQTEWFDLIAIALGGLIAILLGLLRRPALAFLATVAVVALWCVVNFYGFAAWQTWLNFSFPTLAFLLGATVVVGGHAMRENRLRAYAEHRGETLSRYVSPLAVSDLRGGHAMAERTQEAVILFVDLVGFTRASERMSPAETARLLRRFHGSVERAVQANRGVIDKFIGDAALAVFGVPERGGADAAHAVAAARTIAADVAEWNAGSDASGAPAVGCGVGIHSGPVSIGEVGGSEHAQITVTGDTVNVASRLEALTRDWRTSILISNAVMQAARQAGAGDVLEGFQELPLQSIRGREDPIAIWAWPAPAADGVSSEPWYLNLR